MIKSRTQKGFTIIETLVAITILMIAIAGPLTIANQALHAANDARNQMIASNLAQETIEEVRNAKDNGESSGVPLNTILPYTGIGPYGAEADPSSAGDYQIGLCSNLGAGNSTCKLYLNSTTGYTYDPNRGDATPFSRSFTLTTATANSAEYVLTVTVSWNTGTVSNQIQAQELLSPITR
jgi:prepilin-type N-terminal cleavage/methylation domain-containing protein